VSAVHERIGAGRAASYRHWNRYPPPRRRRHRSRQRRAAARSNRAESRAGVRHRSRRVPTGRQFSRWPWTASSRTAPVPVTRGPV